VGIPVEGSEVDRVLAYASLVFKGATEYDPPTCPCLGRLDDVNVGKLRYDIER
jgi:hypothetical protein